MVFFFYPEVRGGEEVLQGGGYRAGTGVGGERGGWVGRGEAVVLANLSTFRLVGLSICWEVGKLGSWRGAAVYRWGKRTRRAQGGGWWRWCARWVGAGQQVGGLAALRRVPLLPVAGGMNWNDKASAERRAGAGLWREEASVAGAGCSPGLLVCAGCRRAVYPPGKGEEEKGSERSGYRVGVPRVGRKEATGMGSAGGFRG